jgi:hypothetical protein
VGDYVSTARKALASSPDLDLYDGPVPDYAMLATFGEPAHVSTVLGAYAVEPTYDVPSADMKMLDNQGNPRPIRLVFEQRAADGEVKGCGTPVGPGETVGLHMEGRVAKGTWILRVDYFTDTVAVGQFRTGSQTVRFPTSPGTQASFMVIDGPFESLTFDNVGEEGVVCVSSVEVGLPVPDDTEAR